MSRPPLLGNGAVSPAVSPHTSNLIDYVTEAPQHIRERAPPEPLSFAETATSGIKLSEGPFAGVELPYQTAKANAAYITRTFVSTYLITHPHLDHLSGFAVNTASFQHTYRPKRLAALPTTIDAVKDHIFNDIIWPNLSDEDGGVGLITYMRLVEGGNVALGNGDGKGYIEVCDGLGVKCWSVSHGHCMKRHSHRGSSTGPQAEAFPQTTSRRSSMQTTIRRSSRRSTPSDNLGPPRGGQLHAHPADKACVYDSTAFFIRDDSTGKEVLIFGDVEPDSLSLSPRTAQVWADAAPKIAAGLLTGIFIECSYDDSQSDETLFGHLCPRHLIAELKVLAANVIAAKQLTTSTSQDRRSSSKRKRLSNGLKLHDDPEIRTRRSINPHRASITTPRRGRRGESTSLSPTSTRISEDEPMALDTAEEMTLSPIDFATTPIAGFPLQGIKIVIIHVKDSLTDGPDVGETILKQLEEYERAVG
ncbi:MAG: 3',5'-cyclic-nucleotide phosphodiesterase pde1, partial [Pleopsidium flavum]